MSLEDVIKDAVETAVERALRRVLEERAQHNDELLTRKEAAALAKVTPATITRWLNEGLLTAHGSPQAVRIRRDELMNVKPRTPATEKTPRELALQLLDGRRR